MDNVISNLSIYGFNPSIVASGYPMTTGEPTGNRVIAERDFNRAVSLGNVDIGTGHDCYLKGIVVQFDLTFTRQAWLEALRYHFFDIVSSQSTMHKLPYMDRNNYIEYTDPRVIEAFYDVLDDYNENPDETNWRKLIYSYPVGLRLTARVTTNYLQLKTMYKQRRNHRLPEWQNFCDTVRVLPYFEKLCMEEYFNVENNEDTD
jgi:hypothetical protein